MRKLTLRRSGKAHQVFDENMLVGEMDDQQLRRYAESLDKLDDGSLGLSLAEREVIARTKAYLAEHNLPKEKYSEAMMKVWLRISTSPSGSKRPGGRGLTESRKIQ